MSLAGKCQQLKHKQREPSTKMECDYLCSWIKKWPHNGKNLTKMVNSKEKAGNVEEEEECKGHCVDEVLLSVPRTGSHLGPSLRRLLLFLCACVCMCEDGVRESPGHGINRDLS